MYEEIKVTYNFKCLLMTEHINMKLHFKSVLEQKRKEHSGLKDFSIFVLSKV